MTFEWFRVLEVLAAAGAGGGLIAFLRRMAQRRAARRQLQTAIVDGLIEALAGVLEESSILHGRVTPTELASRKALLHARLKHARERLIRCRNDAR